MKGQERQERERYGKGRRGRGMEIELKERKGNIWKRGLWSVDITPTSLLPFPFVSFRLHHRTNVQNESFECSHNYMG